MTARITELPERERPISEQFRLVAKEYVALDNAARLLEGCKDAVFSQMVGRQGDMPVARAERNVKGSKEWEEHVKAIVEARTQANLKKYQLEYIRMKHSEWIAGDANARHEARLGR